MIFHTSSSFPLLFLVLLLVALEAKGASLNGPQILLPERKAENGVEGGGKAVAEVPFGYPEDVPFLEPYLAPQDFPEPPPLVPPPPPTAQIDVPEVAAEQKETNEKKYAGYKLFRVFVESDADEAQLTEFLRVMPSKMVEQWKHGRPTDLFVNPAAKQVVLEFLAKQNLHHTIVVNDFAELLSRELLSQRERAQREEAEGGAKRFDLSLFHSYDEIAEHLRDLAQRFPEMVELKSLGKSFEGRELNFVKIGVPRADGAKKKAVWIDAGIHAREWIAPATALNIINQLLNNANYSQTIREIDVYVMPSLNVDGYEYSRKEDRMWRRTRSVRPGDECIGVDGNRNFPPHFFYNMDQGCGETYSGAHPLSEPETRQLAEFLMANNETIRGSISLHAYGNWIMYSNISAHAPDAVKGVVKRIADKIVEFGGPAFSHVYYIPPGTTDSFAKSIGIPYAFIMELTDGDKGGFIFPEGDEVAEFTKYAVPGILSVAEQVFDESLGSGGEKKPAL